MANRIYGPAMNINDWFEQVYSDMKDMPIERVKAYRMINGSYSIAEIATAFRWFKACSESFSGEKMRVLGYLSQKGAEMAQKGQPASFKVERSGRACVAVYVAVCEDKEEGVAQ